MEFLKNNPWILGVLLPILFAYVARFIKSANLVKMASRAEALGVLLDKIMTKRLGLKNWEQLEEGALPTICSAGREFFSAIERGSMKNNIKEMVKKKIDPDIVKAANDALESLASNKINRNNK